MLIGISHYAVALVVAVRVMLKPRMAASVRLAWILVIEILPIVGILAWILFGEVRMRRADRQRAIDVRNAIAELWQPSPYKVYNLPEPAASISAQATTTGGLAAVRGNCLDLLPEGDEAVEEMARAIDAAEDYVLVLFYIWLDDRSGRRVAKACADAARRGVTVRVIVDALGSRRFVRAPIWQVMIDAGVDAIEAFPLGNPIRQMLASRMDLRNHRKIVVVDGKRAYTGSRNCADMAFAPKRRFGPWVDVLIAVEGPAVRQLEVVFTQDWLSATRMHLALPDDPDTVCEAEEVTAEALESATPQQGDDCLPARHERWPHMPLPTSPAPMPAKAIAELMRPVPASCIPGATVQVVATGPDYRPGTLSDVLTTLIHAARRQLLITTPYYVPDEATDSAICAAARRGVDVTLILPERNDSMLVGAVSAGFHEHLLRAGVRIALFRDGLIHSKILTVDGEITLVGSANLDRRSFDLNYEISLLILDRRFTAKIDARQQTYLARSRELTLEEARSRPVLQRLKGNIASLAAPLL